jgi:hypothetical protein
MKRLSERRNGVKTKYGSMVLPDDFFVEVDREVAVTGTREDSELVEARDLAIARPGKYVRVGEMRWLVKAPSAWVSEVNTGKKKCLSGFNGTFEAVYWLGDETRTGLAGQREYGKAIIFHPSDEVSE